MKSLLAIVALLVALASGAVYYTTRAGGNSLAEFRTVAVKRGDLLSTISATGTVEPEEVVDVGAQVAGLIVQFGADPHDPSKLIDFGSIVEKDTVLAKIDPTPYQAQLDQAEATLESSQANLLQIDAAREKAEHDLRRAEGLRAKAAISEADYDSAVATCKAAKANLAVGKAAIHQNVAALQMAKTNLGYTTITSPVRGVILARRVNIGQTVVASLNAPSLFLIAKDLRRMQVWASVNEADIGHIHLDMPVRFTVDAYGDEQFRGKVTQIRMNATMTQNVVTYTVIVTTDNSGGRLLPYLTANVQFELDHRTSVLLVPNAALRWKPQAAQIDASAKKAVSTAAEESAAAEPAENPSASRLWVAVGAGRVQPVDVTVGITDGLLTEVSGSDVKAGMQIVAGDESEDKEGDEATDTSDSKTRNPFLPPKMPKGSRPPPGPPL